MDLQRDDAPGIAVRMDAVVADSTGQALFWGDARGLRLARPSQAMLVILDQGRAAVEDERLLNRQLFGAGLPMPLARSMAGAPSTGSGLPVARAAFSLE